MFKENNVAVAKEDRPDKQTIAGQIGTVIC